MLTEADGQVTQRGEDLSVAHNKLEEIQTQLKSKGEELIIVQVSAAFLIMMAYSRFTYGTVKSSDTFALLRVN